MPEEEIRKEDILDRDIPERLYKYAEYLRQSLRGKALIACLLCKKAMWINRISMRRSLRVDCPCSNPKHKSITVSVDDLSEDKHLDIVCDILQEAKDTGNPIPEIGN